MYRILLVDDEPVVIQGMKKFPWQELDCSIIGTASDGLEAWEQVCSLSPDIVITDIRMPGIDGLEFSRKILELNENIVVLVLTGYTDFTYAREALKNEVVDYLVKPVGFAALKEALNRAVARLKEKKNIDVLEDRVRSMIPIVQKHRLTALLRDYDVEELDSEDPEHFYMLCLVSPDNDSALDSYVLERELQNKLNASISFREYWYYVFVWMFPRTSEISDFQKDLRLRLENAQEDMKERYDVSFSAVISSFTVSMNTISVLKESAVNQLQLQISAKRGAISIQENPPENEISMEKYRIEIFLSLASTDPCILEHRAESFLSYCRENSRDSSEMASMVQSCWVGILYLVHVKPDGIKVAEVVTESSFLENLIKLKVSIDDRDRSLQYDIDRTVKAYLNDHYSEDISLLDLSEKMGYNPTYLSRLISKSCGKTFMKMLIDVRLRKAKELLMSTDKSVAAISLEVGYRDVGYFITAFRKRYGLAPAQYRVR